MKGACTVLILLCGLCVTAQETLFVFPEGIIPLVNENSRLTVGRSLQSDSALEELRDLVQAAGKGDTQAQYVLGNRLLNGKDLVKNESAAVRYFQKAALKDHGGALFNLGVCYENGTGCARSRVMAARCYERSALQGLPQARLNWAIALKGGVEAEKEVPGIPANPPLARKILETLVREQFSPAERELALFDMSGNVSDTIYTQSLSTLEKLAAAGDAASNRILGDLALKPLRSEEKPSPEKAVACFTRSAESGDVQAIAKLAWCYDKGIGVTMNRQTAVKLYERAALGGEALAMTALADACLKGDVVPKDIDKALSLLILASGKGDVQAVCMLGVCSWEGIGQNRDLPAAERFFTLAAEHGYAPAQYNLGMMHLEKQTVSPSDKEGVKWLEKASEKNHTDAMLRFALCLLNGIGCSTNEEYGMLLMRKAARLGNRDATRILDRILKAQPSL